MDSPPALPHRFAAGVLVVERQQRRWEAALKRQLAETHLVRPCKTLADVREQLALRPGSVVVLDVTNAEQGPILAHCVATRQAGAILGIAGSIATEDECALREAGVTSLYLEPASEELIAEQCRRFLLPP